MKRRNFFPLFLSPFLPAALRAQQAGDGKASYIAGVNAQSGTTYTLVAGDNGKDITDDDAALAACLIRWVDSASDRKVKRKPKAESAYTLDASKGTVRILTFPPGASSGMSVSTGSFHASAQVMSNSPGGVQTGGALRIYR